MGQRSLLVLVSGVYLPCRVCLLSTESPLTKQGGQLPWVWLFLPQVPFCPDRRLKLYSHCSPVRLIPTQMHVHTHTHTHTV